MSELKVKVFSPALSEETLSNYCTKLSKKNNSILFLLENYLGKKLLDDEQLIAIRDVVLTVSADILRLKSNITVGEDHERLQ
jgi:hypothetical protein